MNFSEALAAVKAGKLMTRKMWSGTGRYIYHVAGSRFEVNRPPLLGILPAGSVVQYRPHIDIRLSDGTFSVWTPKQCDLLAEDWYPIPLPVEVNAANQLQKEINNASI